MMLHRELTFGAGAATGTAVGPLGRAATVVLLAVDGGGKAWTAVKRRPAVTLMMNFMMNG
jgi:hypothetical protein